MVVAEERSVKHLIPWVWLKCTHSVAVNRHQIGCDWLYCFSSEHHSILVSRATYRFSKLAFMFLEWNSEIMALLSCYLEISNCYHMISFTQWWTLSPQHCTQCNVSFLLSHLFQPDTTMWSAYQERACISHWRALNWLMLPSPSLGKLPMLHWWDCWLAGWLYG